MDRNLVGRVPGYSSHEIESWPGQDGLIHPTLGGFYDVFMDELNQSLVPLVGPFSFVGAAGVEILAGSH